MSSTKDELFMRTWVRFIDKIIFYQTLLTSESNFGLSGALSLENQNANTHKKYNGDKNLGERMW